MSALKATCASVALLGEMLVDPSRALALTRQDVATIAPRVYAASSRDFVLKTGNRQSSVRIVFVHGQTRHTMDFYRNNLTIWFRQQGTGTGGVSQYIGDVDMDGRVDNGAGTGVFDEGGTVYFSRREREYNRRPPEGVEYEQYWQARYERALADLVATMASAASISDPVP